MAKNRSSYPKGHFFLIIYLFNEEVQYEETYKPPPHALRANRERSRLEPLPKWKTYDKIRPSGDPSLISH